MLASNVNNASNYERQTLETELESIRNLNFLAAQINRYGSIFIFLFGAFGNLMNILILSRRTFRTNSCAILFLAASIANLIAILVGLTSKMLSHWSVDLASTDRFCCKLKTLTVHVSRPIGFWLILLATVDRWLISCQDVRLRRMSSLKNAYRSIYMVIILSISVFCHVLYCNEPNQTDSPMKCYGINQTCRLVNDLLFNCFTMLIPLTLILIFGLLTIRNLQYSSRRARNKRRLIVTTDHSSGVTVNRVVNERRRDANLLLMLFVQIILLFAFSMPLGIEKLYSTITKTHLRSNYQAAVHNLIYSIVLLMNFLSEGMPFYIYTLVGGNIYRRTLFNMILKLKSISRRSTNI